MRARKLLPVVAAMALALGAAGIGGASVGRAGATQVTVSQSLTIPVQATADVQWQCDNTGPTVYIDGTLIYGHAQLQFWFANNSQPNPPHQYTTPAIPVDFGVTPSGGSVTIPKQPAKELAGYTGVGGNPYISFQFADKNDNPLGDKILLGRCVQGPNFAQVQQTLQIPAQAVVDVSSLSCTNDGSSLYFNGNGSHIGFKGVMYLDNNINKVLGVHRDPVSADLGATFSPDESVPKQGSVGGPGGNPWVDLQILQNSSVIGDFPLGRCRQLGA